MTPEKLAEIERDLSISQARCQQLEKDIAVLAKLSSAAMVVSCAWYVFCDAHVAMGGGRIEPARELLTMRMSVLGALLQRHRELIRAYETDKGEFPGW